MGQEMLGLQWKTYEAHLSNAFKGLYNQSDFSDVTLVCDDQTQLAAHKIVLSACSPFLRNILLNNPHPHPLIYLKGIKHNEMQSILQFMCLGETTILKDSFQDVIDVGKQLKVKELYTECEDEGFLANLDEELDNGEQEGKGDGTSTLSRILDETA